MPIGATSENVQTWLHGLSWKAKPLRLLASKVWLCAAASQYESTFEMWDDHPILIKWLDPRPQRQQVVVAGNSGKLKQSKVPVAAGDSPGPYDDPWAFYNPNKKTQPASASANPGVIPAVAARKLDGPIEERLKKQASDLEDFKEQQKSYIQEIKSEATKEVTQLQKDVTQLKEIVSKQSHNFDQQNKINAQEFKAIRQESKDQFAQLAASLQDGLKQTLAKQDHVIASQFQEIKNLLQNKENPPKKLKSVPEDGDSSLLLFWCVVLDLWLGPACLCDWHCIPPLLGLESGVLALDSNEDSRNLRLSDVPVTLFASHRKHSLCEPWPCVNLCALSAQEVPQLLPFNFFARFFGMTVGEASHPGPSHSLEETPIKLVVSNPTAVHKKPMKLSL